MSFIFGNIMLAIYLKSKRQHRIDKLISCKVYCLEAKVEMLDGRRTGQCLPWAASEAWYLLFAVSTQHFINVNHVNPSCTRRTCPTPI